MAKRTKQTQKRFTTAHPAVAAAAAATDDTPTTPTPAATTKQQPRRHTRHSTFSLDSTPGRIVLLGVLGLVTVELFELGQLFAAHGYDVASEGLWPEVWEIAKGYWQTKLMVATYLVKSVLSPTAGGEQEQEQEEKEQ